MRSILQLGLMVLLLLGAGNRVWGKVAVAGTTAGWGFTESRVFVSMHDEPPGLMSSGEAAAWGYDLGMQVGPNLYAYVKQNPWTGWDPHGLCGWADPGGNFFNHQMQMQKDPAYAAQVAAANRQAIQPAITWMNEHPRTMGGVQAVGGGLQIAAGAVGLAAPEPTGLTKVAGGIAIAHGADDVQAGFRQMWSGKHVDNITTQATEGIVRAVGGSDAQAKAAGIIVNIGTGLITPTASARMTLQQIPNDALVVRGGVCRPESFLTGSGVTLDDAGKLQGVSVQSRAGMTVEKLTIKIPNNQVGVTTAGEVRAAGGSVKADPVVNPNNPNHATLSGLTPEKASAIMTVQPNPSKKK